MKRFEYYKQAIFKKFAHELTLEEFNKVKNYYRDHNIMPDDYLNVDCSKCKKCLLCVRCTDCYNCISCLESKKCNASVNLTYCCNCFDCNTCNDCTDCDCCINCNGEVNKMNFMGGD